MTSTLNLYSLLKVVSPPFLAAHGRRLDARRRGCRAPNAQPRGPPRACQRRLASRPELPVPAEACARRRQLDIISTVLRCWGWLEPKLRLPDELLWHPLLPALHRRCTGARFGAAQRGYGQGVRLSPPAVHPRSRPLNRPHPQAHLIRLVVRAVAGTRHLLACRAWP